MENLIDTKNISYSELIGFLRFEAGVSSSGFKGLIGGKHNLKLQQIPEEYAKFLIFLRDANIKEYLELGIGHGGSFLLNTISQPNLILSHAVDNCDYQKSQGLNFSDQYISIKNNISYLKSNLPDVEINFFNLSTQEFFSSCEKKYDAIFIDADHSYEGVKEDYQNSLNFLNPGGILIFHDIANAGVGVKQLWDSLDKNKKTHEFIYSTTCGIGIYKP